jgi:hypothetical protein
MPHPDNRDQNRNVRYVSGRIRTNAANPFDATSKVGTDLTFTRTGVGTATVKVNVVAKNWVDADVRVTDVGPTGAGGQLRVVISNFVQGTDGMWTFTVTQTDLNNAGPAAIEWLASDAKNWLCFSAVMQIGDSLA